MSDDFVGPPSPDQISTQLGNVGAHEIGHDVFLPGYHSKEGLMQDSVAPEVVSDPNLNFTPDEARALRNRFNTAEEQREYELEQQSRRP